MDDDEPGGADSHQEFLRRTKKPEPDEAGDDPMSWRTFGLGLGAFFVAAMVVVLFFQSDTSQARAERAAWLQACGTGDHSAECGPTADEWHDFCFYTRAAGKSHFDTLPKLNSRSAHVVRSQREYDPQEYRKCLDGHARDRITGRRVDQMLQDKERAAQQPLRVE